MTNQVYSKGDMPEYKVTTTCDECKKMMSVIDDIKAEIEHEGEMYPDGDWYISIDRVCEIFDKHTKTGRWIPVSERLPENRNQEVLISLEWGIDIGRYSDGEWHSEWINHYDDGKVLAWMPLPEPYEVEPQESEEI